ncbi:uncharacterized protein MELLADRAFT_91097 [Melampsora larici-populina 98AG31]|uniref:SCP domain-containing protein n=1 Tax=Melampsora larici-populina (strain 98AG31 / pathotype 3-4-7) TaxID=747676 RepID=F4R752_MELLP|nr:uncharacterized protein MELLADRAFT_91097 [Melampsora larici-populina 98AG31]EGG11525.1 hypothetical protein MELLADRAFT_91097 [Melampsora larici-populina 98AG31]
MISYLTWLCSGIDNQAYYDSVNPRLGILGEQISSLLSTFSGIKLLSQVSNQERSNLGHHGGSEDQVLAISGYDDSDDHINNIFDRSLLHQERGGTSDSSVGETLKNMAELQMNLDKDQKLEYTAGNLNYDLSMQGDMSDDTITEATNLKLLRREESTASDIWVKWHNFHRKKFAAPDLSWDPELANRAQKFTNRCNFEHSKPERNGPHYGENLFAGASDIRGIVDAWVNGPNEAGSYNPGAPSYSHFTQVVWRETTQVGCAISACDDVGHFSGSKVYQKMGKKASIVACVYFP